MKPICDMTDQELISLKKSLEYDVSKYHNFQLVRKVQLNSAYGALGNQWFRFYSTDLAEAITLSGQLSIQWIGIRLNEMLNGVTKNKDKDYIIASDTDSLYVNMSDIVKIFASDKTKKEQQGAFMKFDFDKYDFDNVNPNATN